MRRETKGKSVKPIGLADEGKIDLKGLFELLGVEDPGGKAIGRVKALFEKITSNIYGVNENLVAGALVLRMNLDEYKGSFALSLLAYNSGRRSVNNYLDGDGGIMKWQFEYPQRILGLAKLIDKMEKGKELPPFAQE